MKKSSKRDYNRRSINERIEDAQEKLTDLLLKRAQSEQSAPKKTAKTAGKPGRKPGRPRTKGVEAAAKPKRKYVRKAAAAAKAPVAKRKYTRKAKPAAATEVEQVPPPVAETTPVVESTEAASASAAN